MTVETIVTFAFAFFVFAASPGPDNLTILSKTISRGAIYGLAYGMGVVASIFGFVILAAVGFSALATIANDNLRFLQYLGAVYLVYTGIGMWRSRAAVEPRSGSGGAVRLFGLGFLLNVSNPKMPIFYLALLPGVVGIRPLSAAEVGILLLVIALVEVVVVGGHVLLAHRARAFLREPRRLRMLNRGAGSLMIGAGVLVASR